MGPSWSSRPGEHGFAIPTEEAGEWTVSIKADGYSRMSKVVSIPQEEELLVTLQPCGAVSVHVLSSSGAPLPGIEVDLVRQGGAPFDWGISPKTTGLNGEAGWPCAPLGSFYVVANGKDQGTGASDLIVLGSNRPEQSIRLVLDPGGRIVGLVTRTHGRSLEGAVVAIRPIDLPSGHPLRYFSRRATVDQEGTFLFEGLPAASYQVAFEGPHSHSNCCLPTTMDVNVEKGRSASVEIELGDPTGINVRGVLLVDGLPGIGARVSAKPNVGGAGQLPHRTVTDSSGEFQVLVRRPGVTVFECIRRAEPGSSFLSLRARFRIQNANGEAIRIEYRTGLISGRVLDATGKAVARCRVTASGMWGPQEDGLFSSFAAARTGADGNFTLGPLPAGDHEVSLGLPTGQPVENSGPPRAVLVVAGFKTEMKDLTLPNGEYCSIAGLVLGPMDIPAEGAMLEVHAADTPWVYESIFANASGQYQLNGLRPGAYWVRAIRGQLLSKWIKVDTTLERATSLDLKLQLGGTLVVSFEKDVVSPKTKIFIEREEGRAQSYLPSRAGTTRIGPLAPGSYFVRAAVVGLESLGPYGYEETSVTVHSNEEVRISIKQQ